MSDIFKTKPGEITSIRQRVEELVAEHGGLRAAAAKVGINSSYLSRLRNGHSTKPSESMLFKLKLDKIITYRRF